MSDSTTPADNTANQQRGRPFEQGQSGNPTGRPKGSRNKATLAVQALLDGECEAISSKAIELAKGGDMQAIKLVLERVLPPRKDAPVMFDLPKATTAQEITIALSALLEAVSAGELTPQEGQQIAALLEQQRRTYETTVLESKLKSLETLLQTRN